MNWLTENGFWVLIGIAFIAMHLFGHGGHGGHGSRGDDKPDTDDPPNRDRKTGHRH